MPAGQGSGPAGRQAGWRRTPPAAHLQHRGQVEVPHRWLLLRGHLERVHVCRHQAELCRRYARDKGGRQARIP